MESERGMLEGEGEGISLFHASVKTLLIDNSDLGLVFKLKIGAKVILLRVSKNSTHADKFQRFVPRHKSPH